MTIFAEPRTTPAAELADRDELIAAALPYLKGAWGNEAAAYLESRGVSRDEIQRRAAIAALEA